MSELVLEAYKSILSEQFNSHFSILKKRPDIFQVRLPFYHEDGDMIEIYFQELDSNKIRISDYGMSLMRLSYTYEIDTDSKKKVLNRILTENMVENDDGQLFLISDREEFYPSLMQMISTIQKVTNMRQFKEMLFFSMFYENLDNFINSSLLEYSPAKKIMCQRVDDVYSVDYKFTLPNRKTPVFFFE
ncbi:MAG: DUF1828 domain-containing protein [Caldisericia bacterium]